MQLLRIYCLLLVCIAVCPQYGYSQACSGINFTPDTTTGCTPLVVHFSTTGFQPGSSFAWDFGTGYVAGKDTTSKIFPVGGKYSVSLKVTSPTGSVCYVDKPNLIDAISSPVLNFSVSPGRQVCDGGKNVTFIDNTSNAVTREWIIDGVSYTNAANVITHSFASIGNKSVTLKVTNSAGCTNIFTDSRYISIVDSIQPDFCADMVQNTTNTKARFSTSFSTNGRTVSRYEWSFPGGSPSSYTGQTPPEITYADPSKKYNVTLKITMADGCLYTLTRKNFIQPFIGISNDTVCMGKDIFISNLANNNGRGYFNLQFPGSGAYDPKTNAVAYYTPGQYTAVINFKYSKNGCTNKVTVPKYITVVGPGANFNSTNRGLCDIKDSVYLENLTNEFGAPNVTYTWYIHDAATNTLLPGFPLKHTSKKNFYYKFSKEGSYHVTMAVKSDNRCNDSLQKRDFVVVSNPVANFTSIDTSYCFGETIQLRSLASDPLYTYLWNFQNADSTAFFYSGSGSKTNFKPVTPGRYHVTHILQNAVNCSDTVTVKNYLDVTGVKANFSVDARTGCAPATIYAKSWVVNSHPKVAANKLKYEWIVDPSENAYIIDPYSDRTYILLSDNGCYSVALNITDPSGCVSQVYKEELICLGMVPSFTMDSIECLGDTIGLQNYSTNSGNETYRWSVEPSQHAAIAGDTLRSPQFVFYKDTCYKVTMIMGKMINGSPCYDTLTKTVCSKLPTADFKMTSISRTWCAPAAVSFESSSKNAKYYIWDFGDGNVLTTPNPAPTHVYLTNNSHGFDVKFTAVDSNGCMAVTEKPNLVVITGPTPQFEMSHNAACDSTVISFKNTSFNLANYLFDYDDGTDAGTTFEPHAYYIKDPDADSAVYHPVIVATDSLNCSSSYHDTIIIYRTPTADLVSDVVQGCPPLAVQFSDTSSGARGFAWDFESDGIIDDSSENPFHIYDSAKAYTVTLIVWNGAGCIDTIVKKDYINVLPFPQSAFSLGTHSICGKSTVPINNLSKNFTDFTFDYGDGSPRDSNAVSSHTWFFDEKKTQFDSIVYAPKMITYNAEGCSDTITDTLVIYAKPVPGFRVENTAGCAPLTVKFTDTSRYTRAVEWDVNNDGVADTQGRTVTWTYTEAGIYTVKLVAKNRPGCRDSLIVPFLVHVYPIPEAGIEVSDSVVCLEETVLFTDISQSENPIVQWHWDFDESLVADDTSGSPTVEFSFLTPGYHNITLAVTDDKGCTDTIIRKAVFVEDAIPIPVTPMVLATVENNNEVKIIWNSST
ncbi:MAG: PKD domain-containing protein, partial [Bacteroidota bacterium]|nr:PKD domain-containing protein [Bacteroidota bacterium]